MIIGRKAEQSWLKRLFKSKKAELIAVYGRRRIGKTFLIREMGQKNGRYMEAIGKKDADMRSQLFIFSQALKNSFPEIELENAFENWMTAFETLTDTIKKHEKGRFTLFLDELPWMVTQKSGLLQALDHYWNAHWSQMKAIKVVVCGSAASWMLDNLINAKGGLHNRLTATLNLQPFSLSETAEYLKAHGHRYTHQRVLDTYLVTGGVPHYLNQMKKSRSLLQNINDMCFNPNGLLHQEFPRLFRALFKSAEDNLQIIRLIAQKRFGISRNDLIKNLKTQSGGTLTKRIEELEAAGFIKTFIPYGLNNRSQYYRVTDEYSFFYLKWIEPELKKGLSFSEGYWQSLSKTSSWNSWSGYAFETVCLKHIEPIRKALGLENIGCKTGSWRHKTKDKHKTGAQIDLLFDRLDDALTLCEIKYTRQAFKVDKSYAKELMNKLDCFEKQTNNRKELFLALISVSNVKETAWSEELVDQVVLLEDLFE